MYLCLSHSKHSVNVWHCFWKIAIYSSFTCYQSIDPIRLITFVTLCKKVVVAPPIYTKKWQQSLGQEDGGVEIPKEHCRVKLRSTFCFSFHKMCSVGRSLHLSRSWCLYLWNECFRLYQEWYLWFVIFSNCLGSGTGQSEQRLPQTWCGHAHWNWLHDSLEKLSLQFLLAPDMCDPLTHFQIT